tara:strand:+ start:220 stop:606 length:387 start_codon:yes stop_codon:yes gene_type:complete
MPQYGKLKIDQFLYNNSGSDVTVDLIDIAMKASPTFTGTVTAPNLTLTGDVVINNTGALKLNVGTTAQRPGSAAAGMFRYNSTLSKFEGYTSSWGELGGTLIMIDGGNFNNGTSTVSTANVFDGGDFQ